MDRPALYAIDLVTERVKSIGDFAGGFVGERENADSSRIDVESLDQKSNALDKAEGLAGARAGHYERWCGRCSDRRLLRCSRLASERGGIGCNRRPLGDWSRIRQCRITRARTSDQGPVL